jgi:hypothetical protein
MVVGWSLRSGSFSIETSVGFGRSAGTQRARTTYRYLKSCLQGGPASPFPSFAACQAYSPCCFVYLHPSIEKSSPQSAEYGDNNHVKSTCLRGVIEMRALRLGCRYFEATTPSFDPSIKSQTKKSHDSQLRQRCRMLGFLQGESLTKLLLWQPCEAERWWLWCG